MFYTLEAGRHHFEAQMASDNTMVNELLFDLEQYLKTCQVPVSGEELKQVLGDGLHNAVIHGNARNKMLLVSLRIDFHAGQKIGIVVNNAGSGFDPLAVLDEHGLPRRQEGGLYRMHKLGYGISFINNGRTLRLEKALNIDRMGAEK